MRKLEIEVFQYSELSEEAKSKARDWFRSSSCDDTYWSECSIEEAEREGEFLGITFKERQIQLHGGKTRSEKCIYWSGFSCQGDGACFEGTWNACDVKADKVADGWGEDPATTEIKRIAAVFAKIAKEYPEASFTVTHRDRYCHERSVDYDFHFPDGNDGEDWPEGKREEYNRVIEELKEAARDFMRWIYRQLEKEWEYYISDECVAENIEANDYEFTADGSRRVTI